MRNLINATAVVAMLTIPAAAFAQSTTAPAAPKKTTAMTPAAAPAAPAAKSPAPMAKKTAVAHHSASGTVKSSSDTSLVISKGHKDHTFVVNSATEKTGTIESGAKVAVHYTMDGKNMVATAITAKPAKSAKKAKK